MRVCKTCQDELDSSYSFAICQACTEEAQARAVSEERSKKVAAWRDLNQDPKFKALLVQLRIAKKLVRSV